MKKILTLSVALAAAFAISAFGAVPAGYYSSLNGKKDSDLKTATFNLIHNFTKVKSYNALPEYFLKTDVRPQTNYWWDMYSDMDVSTNITFGRYMNREHSFPKSWWGGSTEVSAYVDLNHLYPGEAKANQAKSNYPLGTVDRSVATSFDNGVSVVGYPVTGQGGGAKFVFEPDDEYKGDFARTYFYMVTCYQELTWKYTYMVSQNLYPTLNQWSINLLLQWHRQDPVSEKETMRNEQVFAIQNNRNPFIDLPELAEYLWGEKKGEAFSPGSIVVPPSTDPVLIAPTTGLTLDFGQVALGSKIRRSLFVKGQGLKGTVKTRTYTADYKMFVSETTSIPAAEVCSEQGYWLDIEYTPTELGKHTARVLLSGDFGSVGVGLQGECLAVPTLTACTATAPTDIQSDRYTANWTYPENEVIDYFIVTRTIYSGNEVRTEEVLAEDNFLEMLDFNNSDRESYAVQSVRLGYRSPMSNVVFVDHSGITGVSLDEPLSVQTFPGTIRFICSAPQNGCRIYDIAGREIRSIDTIYNNMDIDMPAGVYLIVTDAHPAPVKVIVRN
ncbi:MAG: endonuclease [Muribaculaceae bacterium]|nr:endonuclease [Muribaculaceae bacterium]